MSESTSSAPAAARPSKLWATLRVAIVCATVSFLGWRYLNPPPPPSQTRLWTPVLIGGKGHELILQPPSRRMEFWTPSAKTKEHLPKDGGEFRPQDKWEILSTDETVNRFGFTLRSNANVLGYRRAEVWGHGKTQLKPGWWWTMTVTTNYSVQNLMHAYRDFWKSSNAVFVEVIENPGGE